MLYELTITPTEGIELIELAVEKETAKQFKVKRGSKLFRSVINKYETEHVCESHFANEYHVWFTDLADLPRFKEEIIERLNQDLEKLLTRASTLETHIENLKRLEVQ